jgi:TnpA family transposase
MAARFLNQAERASLNEFPANIEEQDVTNHFFLSPKDLEEIALQRGEHNRLGFALLLCGLRYLGFFPNQLESVPENALHYLSEQLDVDASSLANYGQRGQTRREHQQWIMRYLGFRWLRSEDESDMLDWLSQRALENPRPSVLFQQASERLYKQRLVRPAISSLEAWLTTARQAADELSYSVLAAYLDETTRQSLDKLLSVDANRGESPLSWLRRAARGYNAEDILDAIAKLNSLEAWRLDAWDVQRLPPARLEHLAQLARHSSSQALVSKAPQQRYPILMAFLLEARKGLTDEILDLYDNRIAESLRDSKNELKAHRLQLSQNMERQVWYFGQIGTVVLDEEVADPELRPRIFDILSRTQLEEMMQAIEAQREQLDELHFFGNRYSYLRRFFPQLLATLDFRPQHEGDSLMEGIQVLRELNQKKPMPALLYEVPTDFVQAADWRWRVFAGKQSINRRWYELCIMSLLRDSLRSGRIWVENSRRYTNLENYLIPESLWEKQRSVFLDLVNGTAEAEVRLADLQGQLEAAYSTLDEQVPHDEALIMEGDRLVLKPFEGEDEESPFSRRLQGLLPHLQLAELLHEVDTWTNFSKHFEHAAGSSPRIPDLNRHLYAVILAQARNIDFQQMVDVVDLSYRQMHWANNWYVREETLQTAHNTLVNYQYAQWLSHYWGDGRFSSSDGQRFPVAVRTQNATPLPRYFGFGRGLTFLTWTSSQYSQYGTLVTPPTHGEAAYTLDKILDNETELKIEEHSTDTGGYTELIFALFDLLGMQFAPRLKDISDTTLYCIDPKKAYKHIQGIIRRKINLQLIIQHWDEILRIAASLKFKWVTASWLIRKLQAFPRQHILTRALQEYGRLVKSIFILRYFQNEAYRRRIGSQLNKGEKMNSLRAYLHSANRGKIRKKYPEEHLNQANCLNLVTNAITVWNTVYMQAAIEHLREQGEAISEEELSHLSPARFEHINIYGKFSFEISVPLNNAGLRPLASMV